MNNRSSLDGRKALEYNDGFYAKKLTYKIVFYNFENDLFLRRETVRSRLIRNYFQIFIPFFRIQIF